VVGLLNHFWLTIFSEEDFRNQAGLKYISHMWDRFPYWYLWVTERSGVYKLELQETQDIDGYEWLAILNIKYYPQETEAYFNGLAVVEKLCRKSEIFRTHPAQGNGGCPCHSLAAKGEEKKFTDLAQGTDVPSYPDSENIPEDFFYADNLFVAYNTHAGSLIRVKSQTRWQVVMAGDAVIRDNQGVPMARLQEGQVDRDYPGFEISHFLYQRFIQCWVLFQKYKIQRERIWKGKVPTDSLFIITHA
jgi:hypothetical protein